VKSSASATRDFRRAYADVCVAIVAASSVACATAPVPSSEAKPVPEERVRVPDFLNPEPGRALLVVTRDKGLRASACTMGVHVDGTLVVDLRPGEQARLYVDEGDHLIGASSSTSVCITEPDQVTVNVTRAKPTLLRISAGGGEGIVIEPSAF
jgi:hypothetical protein